MLLSTIIRKQMEKFNKDRVSKLVLRLKPIFFRFAGFILCSLTSYYTFILVVGNVPLYKFFIFSFIMDAVVGISGFITEKIAIYKQSLDEYFVNEIFFLFIFVALGISYVLNVLLR